MALVDMQVGDETHMVVEGYRRREDGLWDVLGG